MRERATLRDIASRVGVSLTTVSQTLNNKGAVSQKTRTRVLKAAEALGYQQRVVVAPRLNAQMTSVAMVVKHDPDASKPTNPFHYDIIKGVEKQCRALGLDLRYTSVDVDENSRTLELPDILANRDVHGVLMVGAVVEDGPGFLEAVGDRPLVFVNGYLRGAPYDRVGIDNRSGAFDATKYLTEQGHRKIGFVGGGEGTHPSIGERREGYRLALLEAGIAPPYFADSLILRPDFAEPAAHSLLSEEPGISAVVAASDNAAMGVMKAAASLGLRLPEDLSLVGFDNLSAVRHLSPPLTTINIDKAYMGALAVRHLYDSPVFPERPSTTLLVRPNLVVRSSVRERG